MELIEHFRLGFANRTLAYRLAPKQYGAAMNVDSSTLPSLQVAQRPAPASSASRATPQDGPVDSLVVSPMSSDLDESVVGVPFPLALSVSIACKRDHFCDEIRQDLARMKMEPRDVAWATEMRDSKITWHPGRINSLPEMWNAVVLLCRRSDFRLRSFLCRFSYLNDDVLFHNLGNGLFALGYETDESGADLRVTVALFARR